MRASGGRMTKNSTFSFRNISISILVIFLLVISGYQYIRHQQLYPSTDDAYIHGNILYIAPQIAGQLIDVNVTDFQYVDKGMIIASIAPQVYQARVAQAKAALENATSANNAASDAIIEASVQIRTASSQLYDIQEKYNRNIILVNRGILAKQAGDDLKAQLAQAKNNLDLAREHMQQLISAQGASATQAPAVKQAAAALLEATINLSYTQIIAPVSGHLGQIKVRPGSVVFAGQAMMPLIEEGTFWVNANYKEDILGSIKPTMPATIVLDMYPNIQFSGEVVAISPASGNFFSLLPPENATGNWVKIPQRFPVRLSIKNNLKNQPLRIGASASVIINTQEKVVKNDK